MKKRILSVLMALALCLTLLPAPAWAAEDTLSGGTIVQEEQEEATPATSEQAVEDASEMGSGPCGQLLASIVQPGFKVGHGDAGNGGATVFLDEANQAKADFLDGPFAAVG